MALWVGLALLAAISQVAGSAIERSYGSRRKSSNPIYCGYSVERYSVEAEDGYITTVFRIPRSNSSVAAGPPVLLQHGFLSSSDAWYLLGDNSLSCMLARAGYDVWLSNARGNSYSMKHKSLNPYNDRASYWDFSFHEMAVKDLSATIDYIRTITKMAKLSYIGHGMGGTLDYTLLSEFPEYNKKINVAVSLAPAVYIHKLTNEIFDEVTSLPVNILKYLKFLKWLSCTVIFIQWPSYWIDLTSETRESTDEFMLQTLRTVDYIVNGAGQKRGYDKYDRTSVKTLQHFFQLGCSGRFQKFGTGFYPFMLWSESWWPPKYDLTNVKTKHVILYSDWDWLITNTDVLQLCAELPQNMKECEQVGDFWFGHFDFLKSQSAKVNVNDKVLRTLGIHVPPMTTTTTTTTEAVNPECLV